MATTVLDLSKFIRDDNDDDEVWVTHYSSNQQILLVGEGDFSFSCCLATRFGSASNICASSLDSYDDVVRKYKKARSNLETLKRLGAILLHGVDATKLQFHRHLHFRRFDRVIFNFPHAGFHSKESDPCQIQKHRKLVFGFFHGASHMLRANGQIHVSHKNNAPFCHWELEELASRCSLALIHCVAFDKCNYPGYENKRGDGSRCDQPFPLGECSTFKFRVSSVAKELYAEKVKWRRAKERESKFPQASSDPLYPLHTQFQGVSQRPVSLDVSYHHQDHNKLRQLQDPYEDASFIQRSASFALERNHARFQDTLRYTERSSFQYHDFPFLIRRAFFIRTMENHQKDNACFVKTFRFKLVKNRTLNALTASMKFITGMDEGC
ncbi:heavy metal-associated isoprenylated plant protein 41 [Eutrema salsugineum]|uniref:heavy metal-associated isoprenylated plant protein 41 n=1 Tax=Eutrema salsugineum TaxID=72664 RepID=UPI000CED3507|nr:heavy metal-associated isoprenylated plant protein 41 [Eutrema salsugineum]